MIDPLSQLEAHIIRIKAYACIEDARNDVVCASYKANSDRQTMARALRIAGLPPVSADVSFDMPLLGDHTD